MNISGHWTRGEVVQSSDWGIVYKGDSQTNLHRIFHTIHGGRVSQSKVGRLIVRGESVDFFRLIGGSRSINRLLKSA